MISYVAYGTYGMILRSIISHVAFGLRTPFRRVRGCRGGDFEDTRGLACVTFSFQVVLVQGGLPASAQ